MTAGGGAPLSKPIRVNSTKSDNAPRHRSNGIESASKESVCHVPTTTATSPTLVEFENRVRVSSGDLG
jgi:hypothetical protein